MNETWINSLLESAPDAMVILNQHGAIELVNAQAVKMFGQAREEMIGKPVDLLLPHGLPNAPSGLADAAEITAVEMVGRRKSGEHFPIELSLSPLVTDEGRLLSAGIRDISERKRMEEKNLELASLLDKANDAIVQTDLEGRIVFWNQGAVRTFGWCVEEAVGKSVGEILFHEAAKAAEARAAALEHGKWVGEFKSRASNDRYLFVRSHWTLVRDSAGERKSILSITTDITREKQLEEHSLRSQRLDSIGTLAGGIAHDLNNILSPILMSAEMLKLKNLDTDSREMAQTIQSSAERGAKLVRQILTFTRGATGEQSELQLRHLIKEIRKMIREAFPPSVEIVTDVANDLWPVRGDASQMDQVIMNLCVNARDAMPEGGRLEIRAGNYEVTEADTAFYRDARLGPCVLLRVSDTGTGIPPEIRDRIFDPFFTTKEQGKGTGLGLATVAGIVKSHGGLISFDTEMGKGTCFKVLLPAVTNPTAPKPVGAAPGVMRGQGECILVVEDEATLRTILCKGLDRHGYRSVPAKDGTEALSAFIHNRDRIRLVITDLMMPNLAGSALIRVLNNLEPRLPIIACSGLAQSDPRSSLEGCDVQGYLTKPFTIPEVLTQVSDALAEQD